MTAPAVIQPRSLPYEGQRAQATRTDLWPDFLPPPPLDPWDDDGVDERDDEAG